MILYDYFRSSAAYRVRIALALKGLEAKSVPVNLKPTINEHKGDAFLAINPQGRLPYFVDDTVAIGQSPAILEYLEEAYPDVPLLPQNIADRAVVRQLANIIACDVHPLNNVSVLSKLKQEFGADEVAVNDWYADWICKGFQAFESITSSVSGSYCFGDKPTHADIYLVPQLYNARRFNVPLDAFPSIVRIDANCNKLAAFQKALPENQPDAAV
ncbi:maleylacetoacetate isomerase [Kordiimonas aquimaris]|uniref:maleylacetoacetate isomerase n=1 Tax=Kordiimonas aquimaris TaxID=707591 RepID=UPI0021D0813C|nr:maleylacetoacetate isomerase [Kordiimonas aquimaris]